MLRAAQTFVQPLLFLICEVTYDVEKRFMNGDHMRIVLRHAVILLLFGATNLPLICEAQVDQQRAAEYFKEAQVLCKRDNGRMWGVSLCGPMVIGDMRTGTFATSEPAPAAPRPAFVGMVNAPLEWGGTTW